MDKQDIGVIFVLLIIGIFFGMVGYQLGLAKHYYPLEECRLNATYYEERIESYKYEIEALSSEIESYYKMSEKFHDSGNWVLWCADNCTIT